jgi:penicillin amidase
MPGASDPPEGFIASANNNPRRDGAGPYLGADWVDGYRVTRLAQALDERSDWDLDGCASLQCDVHSLPWEEMRPLVLPAATGSEDAEQARALLAAWDGRVSANSPAATLFELFVADMCRRAISARAPRAAQWALGRGSTALSTISALAVRHVGLLVRLLRSQPPGWLRRPWEEEVRASLEWAVQTLRAHHGHDPRRWAWGEVRPLTLKHAFGARRPLGRVFDLGPFPWGGDANTVAQASSAPLDPTGRPLFVPTLRAVMDVGAWDEARFCLAGGQSGNPMSPHYSDMVPRWRANDGIPIAWSPAARARATVAALVLEPNGSAPPSSGARARR